MMDEKTKKSPVTESPFIDVLSDWGFKRMFGEDRHKKFLIDFLNAILPDRRIVDLAYRRTVRSILCDAVCESGRKELFVVELHRHRMRHFMERLLYYTSVYYTAPDFAFLLMRNMLLGKGGHSPRLCFVCILNFVQFEGNENPLHHLNFVEEESGDRVEALDYNIIELPKFGKGLHELQSGLDEWCYLLKHIGGMASPPAEFGEKFDDFFLGALAGNLNREERFEYQDAMKVERDEDEWLDAANEDGVAEGLRQGAERERLRILGNMCGNGLEDKVILPSLGICAEELAQMKLKMAG